MHQSVQLKGTAMYTHNFPVPPHPYNFSLLSRSLALALSLSFSLSLSLSLFLSPSAVFCQIPCLNGGRCIGRDHCWCPSNSTGKFCHLPAPPPTRHQGGRKDAHQPGANAHTMYTLPLSNQQGDSMEFLALSGSDWSTAFPASDRVRSFNEDGTFSGSKSLRHKSNSNNNRLRELPTRCLFG